jgi:glucuronokinase
MSTGRSLVSTCAARAALAGNPSDGYGGAVVAVPVSDLNAMASATEAERFTIRTGDPDLERLLRASADGYLDARGELPPVRLSASTSIPRSVGLAGSSALVIATLRSLAAWTSHRWDPIELADLALTIERDRLGIPAGLQDRLVQAIGKPVVMTFDPVGFRELSIPETMTLFIAWNPDGSEPSDTVHRSLRRRFDGGDARVQLAMRDLAVQAERAGRAIEAGDRLLLGDAMDRTFDLRASIIEIDPRQQLLIDLGRAQRAAVNSPGSGGSVIGLARHPEDLPALRSSYERNGCEFLPLDCP